ncbi:hypothetical protein [Nannocystis pusilla]|uniref:hypothetical protein n=1 Tax=Nannocystis pusilla TaxID=889268 RepID=UPI003B79D426
MVWSALVLGLTTIFARPSACDLASLDKLRASLTQAYLNEEFDRVLELAECELRALRSAPAWMRDPLDGSPEHPCKPLEVIFNVCNEQRPALGCAEATLVRHAREGCSEMPGFAVEHHRMRAQYHHRRLEYAEEFAALAAAADRAAEDAVCWYEESDSEDPTIELAITEAQRGQLAAELRGWHVLRASVAATDRLLAQASQPNPSTVADIRNLLAWSMLLAREAGGDAGDPTPQLAAALDIFEALQHRAAIDNVRINLGLAALQRGVSRTSSPLSQRSTRATCSPSRRSGCIWCASGPRWRRAEPERRSPHCARSSGSRAPACSRPRAGTPPGPAASHMNPPGSSVSPPTPIRRRRPSSSASPTAPWRRKTLRQRTVPCSTSGTLHDASSARRSPSANLKRPPIQPGTRARGRSGWPPASCRAAERVLDEPLRRASCACCTSRPRRRRRPVARNRGTFGPASPSLRAASGPNS